MRIRSMALAIALVLVLTGCNNMTAWLPTNSPTPTPTSVSVFSSVESNQNTTIPSAGATATPEVPTPTALVGRLTFAGSTTVQPLVEKLGAAYHERYPDVGLEIAAGGSVVGINAVQDGSADIGMASRELHEDEYRPGMERYQIAIDVLAIIVHSSNPVTDLSRAELQGIYLGEITNWSEVGGEDRPILPVIREVSSGTRGAFDEIALDGADPVATADTQITAGEVETRVASTLEAIGYVGFGNIGQDVKVLTIDGIMPSPEAAQDGSYQLQRPLLLLLGPLSRPLACSFVTFALSNAGQEVVAADGWVPVAPSETAPTCGSQERVSALLKKAHQQQTSQAYQSR